MDIKLLGLATGITLILVMVANTHSADSVSSFSGKAPHEISKVANTSTDRFEY